MKSWQRLKTRSLWTAWAALVFENAALHKYSYLFLYDICWQTLCGVCFRHESFPKPSKCNSFLFFFYCNGIVSTESPIPKFEICLVILRDYLKIQFYLPRKEKRSSQWTYSANCSSNTAHCTKKMILIINYWSNIFFLSRLSNIFSKRIMYLWLYLNN